MKYLKYLAVAISIFIIFESCKYQQPVNSINPMNWEKRTYNYPLNDSLKSGTTYLSVYSNIYSQTEQTTHNLTVTVSMRNISRVDTIFIANAEYYDTEGKLIRTYFDKTIYLKPMETVEIVIDQEDSVGGTGGNFLFSWKIKPNSNEPFFEGVMISTYGQQGLSFTTQGKKIQ